MGGPRRAPQTPRRSGRPGEAVATLDASRSIRARRQEELGLVEGLGRLLGQSCLLVELPEQGIDLQSHIEQIERRLLEAALAQSRGVRIRAAELLKMSYRSFRHYAKKYNL